MTDVEAAWGAFAEFLQLDIAGIDPTPDSDADGFIIQWGRRSWSDNRLILTFTRQLAIADVGDHDDPGWQPELWQLALEMAFVHEADLVGLDSLDVHDTGIKFAPTGPLRAAALAHTRMTARRYAPVRAAWLAAPASSGLSFDSAC
ncbi:ligand-gated ion channel [Micromonospora auratinigra]|uniref:Uncharacterized protein n=1 Tax=Micromonospora auratinigra TaxID=261654 RepID=A0A1A8ZA33_9ACTN|nr:hypothetical protein [Micromonospora auratinigra]SBT40724.1 hypothetical protein GA0070611_1358 [Micromonospora auratinigra]